MTTTAHRIEPKAPGATEQLPTNRLPLSSTGASGGVTGEMTMSMYRGQVIDEMTGVIVRETRTYMTWEQAHHAAERLAKRSGYYTGGRYSIRVA